METTTRISQIEMDGADLPTLESTPIVEAAAGEVSPVARARVEAGQSVLARAGYSAPQGDGEGGVTAWAGLAMGTRCNMTGDENLALSRTEWASKPATLDGLEKFAGVVDREERRQVDHVALASLRCRAEDGALAMQNGKWHVVDPSPRALSHLASFLSTDRGLPTYLPAAPFAIRHSIVSEYARMIAADERRKDKTIQLATRKNPRQAGGVLAKPGAPAELPRELYRVASDKYASYEANVAARDLIEGCSDALGESRCEIVYDGERARFTFWFHADHVVDLAAGDVFKIGVIVSLDDVRAGAIRVSVVVVRNMCLNLIILGEQTKNALVQRHVGKGQTEIAANVRAAVEGSTSELEHFLGGWRAARSERILDGFAGDPQPVFEGLVGAGLIKGLPGRGPAQVEALLRAWNKEPGHSRADVVNAITRAAHEEAWWTNPFESEEVEAEAGKLLYVKNIAKRIDAGRAVYADKFGIELT